MSEDFVVKFLANAELIVAKNFLKTFAMSFLSLTSFPSFMIKDAVLFDLVFGSKSLRVLHSFLEQVLLSESFYCNSFF